MSGSPFSKLFKTPEQKKEIEEKENKAKEEIKRIKKSVEKDVETLKKLSNEERLKLISKKCSGKKENLENLCIEEGLKKNYLNKDFQSVVEYFKTFKSTNNQGIFHSTESNMDSEVSLDSTIEDTDKEIQNIEEMSKYFKTNKKVKIKLIIAEQTKSIPEKNFKKLLSPFASTFNLSPQFGIFHTAVSIGPWLLEWTNKSLCVPKACYSNAAFIALDVETTLEIVDYELIIDRLCEVITRWNTLYEYDQYKRNCQHFVDDLLANLDISQSLQFKSQIGDFIKNLRNQGCYETSLHLSQNLREDIQVKKEKILFKSHKQIDEFVINATTIYPRFSIDYKEELMLLKSFDRAFWLRHLGKDKNNSLFTPLRALDKNDKLELKCPFNDPTITGTFGKDDWILSVKEK